jgi:hypothetical protein
MDLIDLLKIIAQIQSVVSHVQVGMPSLVMSINACTIVQQDILNLPTHLEDFV